jgi:hypothetical protein
MARQYPATRRHDDTRRGSGGASPYRADRVKQPETRNQQRLVRSLPSQSRTGSSDKDGVLWLRIRKPK